MADTKLTLDDLRHLAKLASLEISDERLNHLAPQLSEILNYVSQLQKLDLKDIPETAQVTGLVNINKLDDVHPGLSQADALSQAPKVADGYVVVPGVFESTDDA